MSRPVDDAPGAATPTAGARSRPGAAIVFEAESLFRGGREILIAHAGQHYRLRITQNGKLILTK